MIGKLRSLEEVFAPSIAFQRTRSDTLRSPLSFLSRSAAAKEVS